ncbi:hypothetical protein KP509_39G002400 [Ceratopteris richardii]|uniref:EGF-like calcium-binding domain-containing protein n=2 Tax=Ceratopteris richardii TaxID=49495 RepID=A0A8T2PXT4_CERRI|nr:hypothetical protein KP509_39G002400 [Ceratopteris richardii]
MAPLTFKQQQAKRGSDRNGVVSIFHLLPIVSQMRSFIFALAFYCLALAPFLVSARFVVEKNSLTVISPDYLRGSFDSAIGNFGIPQYGGTLAGTVSYSKDNEKACKEFNSSDLFRSRPGGMPTFVMVMRGDCYFALKVWNAQKASAAAVLVVDDRVEPLITMDSPGEDAAAAQYLNNISIPSALVQKDFGDRLKEALDGNKMVSIKLDWREALPHPDARVEYEIWSNSNDECGTKCDVQTDFVKNFRGAAQLLEKGGYTMFTPHYITWYCPKAFINSKQCKTQCINHGRYCAPDPEQDFNRGYDGKDVVLENLRQLCVHKVADKLNKSWIWWDYVTDFHIRCPMKEKKYNQECAEEVIKSLGVDLQKVRDCMGDPNADADNEVLKAEQEAQVGKGTRGDVTILPTVVVNDRQYRGKLDRGAVLKAICSGFQETTEPPVCLRPDMETNECLTNNGGCWEDKELNATACKDTFRGRVCECPMVHGVQFQGDGYKSCRAMGSGWCQIQNGGCWQGSADGKTFTACSESKSKCECPPGFEGDGVHSCEDIDECKMKSKCQCPECSCSNTYGSYECKCQGDLLYIREHDVCLSKKSEQSKAGYVAVMVILIGLCAAGIGAYIVYKYRLRSYMDSEVRAIMAQYMPLDSQDEVQRHTEEGTR